jgi:hypothetical protein
MGFKALLETQRNQLKDKISTINDHILQDFPIETLLSNIRFSSEIYRINNIKKRFNKINTKLDIKYNAQASVLYNKLALMEFIKDSQSRLKSEDLQESVITFYNQWFARVLRDMAHQPDKYYSSENLSFIFDIAVCCLSLIPIGGAWLMGLSRTSRKAFFVNGGRQFLRYLIFTFLKQGGLKPYYVIHTYFRYIPRFNRNEMEKAYLRIADLLKKNPRIKGIYRSSWFLDPKLDDISPNLAYLRKLPIENGARLFRIGTSKSDIKNAITNSPERKKLYEGGNYKPACYAYIWPRNDVLKWANGKLDTTVT